MEVENNEPKKKKLRVAIYGLKALPLEVRTAAVEAVYASEAKLDLGISILEDFQSEDFEEWIKSIGKIPDADKDRKSGEPVHKRKPEGPQPNARKKTFNKNSLPQVHGLNEEELGVTEMDDEIVPNDDLKPVESLQLWGKLKKVWGTPWGIEHYLYSAHEEAPTDSQSFHWGDEVHNHVKRCLASPHPIHLDLVRKHHLYLPDFLEEVVVNRKYFEPDGCLVVPVAKKLQNLFKTAERRWAFCIGEKGRGEQLIGLPVVCFECKPYLNLGNNTGTHPWNPEVAIEQVSTCCASSLHWLFHMVGEKASEALLYGLAQTGPSACVLKFKFDEACKTIIRTKIFECALMVEAEVHRLETLLRKIAHSQQEIINMLK